MHYRHLHKFSHKILTPEIFLYYSAQFVGKKKFRAIWGLFNDILLVVWGKQRRLGTLDKISFSKTFIHWQTFALPKETDIHESFINSICAKQIGVKYLVCIRLKLDILAWYSIVVTHTTTRWIRIITMCVVNYVLYGLVAKYGSRFSSCTQQQKVGPTNSILKCSRFGITANVEF